ncbi:MAG: thiopurine S-methyltransferase [Gemmatimonadales bacterium]
MDADFWHTKWAANETGFHEGAPNALLVRHLHRLGAPAGGRFLLPLCGKSQDIPWLVGQGFRVVGAELSPIAVEQFFTELGVRPDVTSIGRLTRYRTTSIEIFCGDIFDLTALVVGRIDAIYDRAALVALPAELRGRYAKHLVEIAGTVPQLLISFDYDQAAMDGPPFSVKGQEIANLYLKTHRPSLLEQREVAGGLKGQCEASEQAWILEPLGS